MKYTQTSHTGIIISICLLIGIHGHLSTEESAESSGTTSRPLQHCISEISKHLIQAEHSLPHISQAADFVAKRWGQDVDIYTAGDPCATDELFYRAGGLIGIKRVGPYNREFNGIQVRWNKIKQKKSIVVYSMHRGIEPSTILFEDLKHLSARADTVVLFGSSKWASCQRFVKALEKALPPGHFFFIDTALEQDTAFRTANNQPYGDYAGMVTTIYSWTFTAELIAACTRLNKMPAIWPSGAIPGFEKCEEKYQTTAFHETLTVKPIKIGTLGTQYLDILARQIQACRQSSTQVITASKLLAATPKDKVTYVMVESHLLANETRFPKDFSNWLLAQRAWRWRLASPTVENGDSIFWIGSFHWPTKQVEQAISMKNNFVGLSLYGPGQNPQHSPLETNDVEIKTGNTAINVKPKLEPISRTSESIVWVPTPWQYPDAVLQIDDYPLPACPTSSIIQGIILWSTVGEVININDRLPNFKK